MTGAQGAAVTGLDQRRAARKTSLDRTARWAGPKERP